jgi:hypothetical protein
MNELSFTIKNKTLLRACIYNKTRGIFVCLKSREVFNKKITEKRSEMLNEHLRNAASSSATVREKKNELKHLKLLEEKDATFSTFLPLISTIKGE